MMKKIILLAVFLLGISASAQERKEPTVSISFENESLATALAQLKAKAGIQIFYPDSWIPEKQVSGNYQNTAISTVLEDLLDESLLNFYQLENGDVVLTRNSMIYSKLPEGFFGKLAETDQNIPAENEEETLYSAPVLYENTTSSNQEVQTVRIGKENRRNNQSRFRLSGHAYDKKTGEPITNLAILVNDSRTGVSTDIDGYYEISLRPGINLIQTKSLTNENVTRRIIIYNDGSYDLQLAESLEQLGEVQISSNADKNVDNANTGEEEIDIENIKNIPLVLGERDIMKVATTLPGISTTGEGSAGFNVRGGKADQNLILLDDAVMYNPAHFFGIFSAINPFTTGEATIYKGNIPAKYGGRLSSVFDIQTKDAATDEFQGEASIGPVTSNLALQLPIIKEKSGLMIGGRSTYSDWILKNLDEPQLKNSTAFFYDGIAKYNHQINENNKLSLTGYMSKDRFSITSDSVYSYENRIATLHYEHRFNDRNRGNSF